MSPEQVHQSKVRRVQIDGIHAKGRRVFNLKDAKVAIVGLSPRGLSLSLESAARGVHTIGFDPDEVKVAQLQNDDSESGERVRLLTMTYDASELQRSDIFVLCVPSSFVEDGAKIIAQHLKEGALVIVESVVEPGTCEHVLLPILEKGSGLARSHSPGVPGDFFFSYAATIPSSETRAIGAGDEESLAVASSFYRQALGIDVVAMHSIKEAESLRMVEEAVHDTSLALVSELAVGFDKMGVDLVNVISTLSRAPTSLMLPGVSDRHARSVSTYVARSGHRHELDQQFLAHARRTIARTPEYVVQVLAEVLRETHRVIRGTTVLLLGLARDRDSSDTEGSTAIKIRDALVKRGAIVRVFDPFVPGAGVDFKEAAAEANVAIVATDHSMFSTLTPLSFEELGISIVVDARNCLDKRAFVNSSITYRGIGRG